MISKIMVLITATTLMTPTSAAINYQMNKTPPAIQSTERIIGQAIIDFPSDPAEESNIQNARTALKPLDGAIIQPGDVFSFNETVGPRTLERGYVVGYSYSGNKKIPDVGGGVCRASTLLFNAVLDAGLPVIERHPHSMPVDYVQPSKDAAVWWGILDFKFKNNRAFPIILKTKNLKTSIKLTVYEIPNQYKKD